MAWDEWGRIKAESGAQLQLNQLAPAGGGGGAADLASTPAQKKAAANAIEKHLEPDTKKAGDTAEESTGATVTEFSGKDGEGWDTSPALKKAHQAWERQVKALMGRLGSEKSALRNTSILLQNTDVGVGLQTRQSSALDGL
ncbi:hypothetical protein [Streptomyces pacificus]|uniref:Uncharacterized protein n=1 Tax=Streptomyces pacificus TaxID=2705029 RepID=A0A6A0AZI3_9ACTN|nr:hypothetical protein [Streptomyces pacificus]GFH37855.1 hypothetical protein SCWH03_40950 [Streptomyces pacificus]